MGTWGGVSQWCNRLLWIVAILRGWFWLGERESKKGGDGARLALEKFGKAKGRTLVFGFGHLYMNAQSWQIGILLT